MSYYFVEVFMKITTLITIITLSKNTMIGYISGKIFDISDSHVLMLPDSGVGYDIGINEITYSQLVTKDVAELYIYHHITENAQSLFWFVNVEEKKLFTELLKISWVGWKVALQILSLWENKLIQAVQDDDKQVIESIKGIGKKMAEKIVLELKDKDFVKHYIPEKFVGIDWIDPRVGNADLRSLPWDTLENIKSTLQNMWYQSRDIERVLVSLPEDLKTVEQILPYMIREL